MNTIQTAYINALLADASYVEAIRKGELNASAFKGRLTQSQADFLAANFKVKDSVETPSILGSLVDPGFDAVVWEGKENTPYAGQVFVSMRGTQGATDIADDISLAATGVPKDQIVGMVNWWMRMTTPPEQKAIQVKYGPVGTGVMDPMTQQEIMVDKFSLVANSTVMGTGTLLGQSSIAGVNGHSLGGYLATAFTRLFGGGLGYNVQSVNTFNSAGFNSLTSSSTESTYSQLSQLIGSSLGLGSLAAVHPLQTNYYADNGWEVTTNTWGEMGFLMPGFNQYGARIALNQEEGLGSANHSMYKLTDLLALGAALEKLDPTLTFARLNELVKASSNDMKGSYEGVLDMLRQALAGPGTERIPAADSDKGAEREAYHATLASVQANPIFKELSGKLLIRAVSTSDLRAMARNDFGALVALQDLSALSISGNTAQARSQLAELWQAGRASDYAAWSADKASTTATSFTDQWLTDRAAMLAAVIARNKGDVGSGILAPNPSLGLVGGRQFTDLATSTTLTVGLDVQTNSQIIFGTNGNDASGLSGGSADDRLYAMAGDDVLDGKGGNDTLEGGTGADTYAFSNQFGKDTLIDSDGSGKLTLDGEQLQGGKATGTANQWCSTLANGQEVLYQLVQDARSSTGYVLRVGKKGDSANTITINNADPARLKSPEGFLGIKLDSKVDVALQASNQSTGTNYWSQSGASLDALAGKASSWVEGVGQSFKVSLSQAAKAGETLVLSAMPGLKAILGDSVVEANGATITLAEGQTQVSFALVSSAPISADMTGALSVAATVHELRSASELIATCAYSTGARCQKHHASCAANGMQWEVAA